MKIDFRRFWEKLKEIEKKIDTAIVVILSIIIILINTLKSLTQAFFPNADPVLLSITLIAFAMIFIVRIIMVVRSEEAKYITQEILKEIRPCEEKPAVVWKSVADATSKLREWILDTKNKDIKIDLYTYSGETFIQHLIDIFKEMCSKDSPPVISSIFLRILTRDCQKKLVIPCEEYGKESRVWKSNMQHRDSNIRSIFISDIENTLKKALPQTTVKLHIKVCPFEPLFKGIMVNKKMVFLDFILSRKSPSLSSIRELHG